MGIAAVLLAAASSVAGPLEGRWRLVEQTYGSGGANRVAEDQPLHLEFFRDRGRLVGRGWFGEATDAVFRWPLPPAAEGTTLRVEEIVTSPREDAIRARYRTAPAADETTVTEFVEEYRVSDDGRLLEGTVTVSLVRDGEPRGSYTWHRRFERER